MKPNQWQHRMSRRAFLRRAMVWGAGATALGSMPGLLAACGGTPTAAPTTAATAGPTAMPTSVPVQDISIQLNWIETSQWGPFFAAEQQGFDTNLGIHQVFIPGGPQVDPLQSVAGGTAPIGIAGGLNQLVLARSNGLPLKAFGAMTQRLPFGLISLASNPITTPQDAIGKRVGLQSGARSTWALIMAANGMSEDQMTIVPVGVDPTPLVSGEVDGYWGTATNQLIALRNQGLDVQIMLMSDAGVPGYGTVYVAPDEVLQSQEDLIVRWLRAVIQGGQYFIEHPEEIAQYTVERAPDLNLDVSDQEDQAVELVKYLESDLTEQKGLYWMDPDVAEVLIQLMVDSEQLTAPVAVEDLMTTSILEKATA